MEVIGLPLHPLVVHAVVVLVPLAALGGLAISALTALRIRYGWLVVAGAFAGLVTNIVAQVSGTSFAATFPQHSPQMTRHFDLGNDLLIWTILLFVGTLVQMVGQWMVDHDNPRGRIARLSGIVITVVCALVATVQTIRIGHAGAVAVWG